ncbi:MAG: PqqD family protein [Rhizomicrobium sp.]
MVTVRKTGDWLSARVGDDLVMMNPQTGYYLGISEVGARIWDLIDTPRELDELCGVLGEEYAVAPHVCRSEVQAFLARLAEQGAVVLSDPAPG